MFNYNIFCLERYLKLYALSINDYLWKAIHRLSAINFRKGINKNELKLKLTLTEIIRCTVG